MDSRKTQAATKEQWGVRFKMFEALKAYGLSMPQQITFTIEPSSGANSDISILMSSMDVKANQRVNEFASDLGGTGIHMSMPSHIKVDNPNSLLEYKFTIDPKILTGKLDTLMRMH